MGGRVDGSPGDRAERVIRRCVSAGRIGSLIQLLFALAESVEYSPRPSLAAWIGGAAVAQLTVICLTITLRRRYLSVGWIRWDVAFGVGALISEHWITDPRFLTGSWVGWAPGVLMATLWAASCYVRTVELTVMIAAATAVYLYVCWPATAVGGAAGVYLSAFSMAVLPILFRLVSGFIRRLSADAVAQTDQAGAAASRLELDRHRLLIHDSASILRLMSDADVTPTLRAVLRAQADSEAARIQLFLAEAAPRPTTDRTTTNRTTTDRTTTDLGTTDRTTTDLAASSLQNIVESVGGGFADLPIRVDAERVAGVDLPAATAAAVASALSAILHNVRLHAHARSVTVQALTTDRGWCLVVADDGLGFVIGDDHGFGLRHQVTGALAAHQIAVNVRSSPGEGTTVLFVAPAPSPLDHHDHDQEPPALIDRVPGSRRGRAARPAVPGRANEITVIRAPRSTLRRRDRTVLETT